MSVPPFHNMQESKKSSKHENSDDEECVVTVCSPSLNYFSNPILPPLPSTACSTIEGLNCVQIFQCPCAISPLSHGAVNPH